MLKLKDLSDGTIGEYLKGAYNLNDLTIPQLRYILLRFDRSETGPKPALVKALGDYLEKNSADVDEKLAPHEPSALGIQDCRNVYGKEYILRIPTKLGKPSRPPITASQGETKSQPLPGAVQQALEKSFPKLPQLGVSAGGCCKPNQAPRQPPQQHIPVDEYCTLSNPHGVYVYNANGTVFDAMLNGTGTKRNNFYLIQLLVRKAPNSSEVDYRTWTRWGRVGGKGRGMFFCDWDNVQDALGSFRTKFKQMTGHEWEDRTKPAQKDKYTYSERKDSSNITNDGLSCAA
jgi:hypothetical protein